MNPLVSVLLPTHDRADVIGYAIRSVLWQTEQDFELLVVGDGCTDDTASVVASFDDRRVRWLDLAKAPFSGYANRNIALRQARGTYIAYAQHDDIWFPDHLSRLLAILAPGDAEWAYSRPLWVTNDGYLLPFAVNLTNADELTRFLTARNYIPSNCVVHTRSALERVGYWPEDIPASADWTCWRRIIESGSGIAAYCPVPTTLHFRSRRKDREHAIAARLRAVAKDAAWWPAACRVPIPAGRAPQQVLFDALASETEAAVERIRAAVDRIIERLAWQVAEVPIGHDDVSPLVVIARLADLERRWTSRSALARQLVSMLGRKLRR